MANQLLGFLEERGFTTELYAGEGEKKSPLFYDNIARCYVEVQLHTKQMDDYAEIGPANHLGYEKRQEADEHLSRFQNDLVD